MANTVGNTYSFAFYFAGTNAISVTDFLVPIFTLNGEPVSDAVKSSLSVVGIPLPGETLDQYVGFYEASYVPDTAGSYILALSIDQPDPPRVINLAEIEEGSTVINLSQDTFVTDALKPQGKDLQDCLLLVFNSKDWDVGFTDSIYAVGQTELDNDGNWLNTPIALTPGTYHIVVSNNFGYTNVIAPYLTL